MLPSAAEGRGPEDSLGRPGRLERGGVGTSPWGTPLVDPSGARHMATLHAWLVAAVQKRLGGLLCKRPHAHIPHVRASCTGGEGGRLACVAYISLSLYTKAGAPGESCLAMHDGRVSTVTDMRRCREPRHGLSPSEVLMKGIQPPRCSGPGPCLTEELPSPCVRRILRNQQALQVLAPATSLQGLNPLCDFSVAHSSGPQPTRGRLEALIGSPPAGPPSPFAGPHTYNLPPCRAKHFYSQSP